MFFNKYINQSNKPSLKITLLTAAFFVFIGVVVSIWSYQNNIKNWENELDNLTLINAEHAKEIFQNGNRVLENLMAVIEFSKVSNEKEFIQFTNEERQYRLIKDKIDSNPNLDSLYYVDSKGNVINFSKSYPPPTINLADRDFFIYLKNHNDLNPYYTEPEKNKGSSDTIFYLARRLNDKNNNLIGIMLIGISSKAFSKYYEMLSSSFNSKVTFALYKNDHRLMSEDHRLMSQGPLSEHLIEKINTEGVARKILDNGKNFGNLTLNNPRLATENRPEELFIGVRKIENAPFYVTVTADTNIYSKGWKNSLFWIWGLTGISFVFVALLSNQPSKAQNSLKKESTTGKEFEEVLFKSNDDIQDSINDRTNTLGNEIIERKLARQELARMDSNTAQSSLNAGKLQVVNGMLHNVGNVLNSLNISVSLIRDHLAKSPIKSLPRLNNLINENRENLFNFLTSDDIGKQVPNFINQMSTQWEKNHKLLINETQNMMESIQHINEIISRYKIKNNGENIEISANESYQLSDVVDSALLIASPGLIKTGIHLDIDYEQNITWVGERVKISQIILNLILNAKDALLMSPIEDKKITVRTTKLDDKFHLEVIDNGIGINSETMKKIFTYGFTTKTNGHGYGLHSSALYAEELGGKLEVFSPGLNKGATFRLTLPLNTK